MDEKEPIRREVNVTELMEQLNGAYAILATLSVSGDAVDAMAAVRAKLRRVMTALEKEEQNG